MVKIEFENYYSLGKLEDLGIIKLGRGNVISRNDIRNNPGKYPIYSSSALNNGKMGEYNAYMFEKEQITWSIDGGGMFFYREKHKYSITNVSGWLDVIERDFLNIKFLYYSLINAWGFKKYDYTNKAHPSVIRNDYNIYIPNIEVQNEMVRILDKFTVLEAELEAELEARINQFEYYKEQSYYNIDRKHYKKIKEIGTIERGNGLARNDFVDEGVPCIHYGQIYTTFNTWTDKTISNVSEELASKLKEVNHGDIIIAVTSETYEDVCKPLVWLGNETIVTGGHTAILRHNQNPKFIAYYLETHLFTKVKYKLSRGVKVIEVRPFDLLDVEIPVPPIEVQNEIVEKLDKFASLINDLEYGLPKEIEMRRQQYEYYRNKLLTFESEV